MIIICGVFHPTNFKVTDINDNDEMWVSDIMVSSNGIRFSDPIGLSEVSPEDFLSGENQLPSNWKTKCRL
ncbi:MAG: hypothetical protein KYX68_12225 [Flavobacterium sp.]|nr:hypothetical protein [Flavobacterium sp.]